MLMYVAYWNSHSFLLFLSVFRFHFYCSSILILYDGMGPMDNNDIPNSSSPKLKLKRSAMNKSASKGHCKTAASDSPMANYDSNTAVVCNNTTHITEVVSEFEDVNVELKMIDLAHTVLSTTGQPDFGYIHGLENLIRYLQEIIDEKNMVSLIYEIIHLFEE